MREPGALIASGRDADIFEYGPGLVLRRSRRSRSLVDEARIMQHVHASGYPVPAVDEVSEDGLSMVMQRIDGVSMVDALGAQPWALWRHADTLADLHRRLHEIEGPDWLPTAPAAPGDRLLHLDLHPLNVMITATGPIVIDWTGASRGDPATDVALTWVLSAVGQVQAGPLMRVLMRSGRRIFTSRFLSHFDRAAIASHLGGVVDWKLNDPNMSEAERQAMRALVSSAGGT